MEFEEVVRRRRMVRDYTEEPVDPAVVERALDHATRAPSAGFTQGWGFLLLDTPTDVARWWAATATSTGVPDRWLAGMMRAPVVVVPCSSRAAYLRRYDASDKRLARTTPRTTDGSPWSVPYWHMDAAMASLLVLQSVVDAGLGACFAGIPLAREHEVRREFALPDDVDPVGVITIGHPTPDRAATGSSARRARRPLAEVVHRGRWGAPS